MPTLQEIIDRKILVQCLEEKNRYVYPIIPKFVLMCGNRLINFVFKNVAYSRLEIVCDDMVEYGGSIDRDIDYNGFEIYSLQKVE